MEAGKRSQLLQQLTHIVHNVSQDPNAAQRRNVFISRLGVYFFLFDDVYDKYDALLDQLANEPGWSNRLSNDYLASRLLDLIATLLGEGDDSQIEARFDALTAELDASYDRYTVYVPLTGISVAAPFEAGSVRLVPMTRDALMALNNRLNKLLMSTANAEEQKLQLSQDQERELIAAYGGLVCAEYSVMAEPQKALSRAMDEVALVIDVLRYTMPVLYADNLRVNIGLAGEALRGQRLTIVIADDDSRATMGNSLIGSLQSLDLDETNFEKMRKINAFELFNIIKRPNSQRTKFERSLLRSVHWFAEAGVQQDSANRFVSLIFAVEVLLTPKDGNPITTAIAEGMAFVLGQTVEKRREIKRMMQKYYRMRSAIVHGSGSDVTETDFRMLRHLCGSLIAGLARRRQEFASTDQLLEWIEIEKLS